MPVSSGRSAGASFDIAVKYGPGFSALRSMRYDAIEKVKPERMLTSEANEKYRDLGLHWDEEEEPTINKRLAEAIAEEKRNERRLQHVINRADGGGALRFGSAMLGSLVDPLNVAAMFIPITREQTFVRMGATMGITGARFSRGFAEGLVGISAVEPITYAVAQREQADYGLIDSMISVLGGATLAGGLRLVFGKVLGDWGGMTTFRKRVEAFQWATKMVDEGRTVTAADTVIKKSLSDLTAQDSAPSKIAFGDDDITIIKNEPDEAVPNVQKHVDDEATAAKDYSEEQTWKQLEGILNVHERTKGLSWPQIKTWLKDMKAKAFKEKTFTGDETAAARYWQGHNHAEITKAILQAVTKHGSDLDQIKDPHLRKIIEQLDSATKKQTLDQPMFLFRGQNLSASLINDIVAGQKHAIPTFFAGSFKRETGIDFMSHHTPDNHVRTFWKVSMPAGTKGMVVDHAASPGQHGRSQFYGEREFMLGRNESFFIRSIKKRKNAGGEYYEISAQLLPKDYDGVLSKATNEDIAAALRATGKTENISSVDVEQALAFGEILKTIPKQFDEAQAQTKLDEFLEILAEHDRLGLVTKEQRKMIDDMDTVINDSKKWASAIKIASMCMNGKV